MSGSCCWDSGLCAKQVSQLCRAVLSRTVLNHAMHCAVFRAALCCRYASGVPWEPLLEVESPSMHSRLHLLRYAAQLAPHTLNTPLCIPWLHSVQSNLCHWF
jgi:hypothetical protein